MLSHFGPHKYEAQSAKAFSLALFPGFPLPREHGSGHLRFDVTDVPPQPNSQTVDNHEKISDTETMATSGRPHTESMTTHVETEATP